MVLLMTFKANCLFGDISCHNIYRQYLCLLKSNPCLLVVYDLQTLRQAVAKIFFLVWKRCFYSIASNSNNPYAWIWKKQLKKFQTNIFKVKASEKTGRSDAHDGFVLCVKRSQKFLQRSHEACSEDFLDAGPCGRYWTVIIAGASVSRY